MVELSRDRVLLVDDEPQVLVALEDLLSDQFTVFTADSAATALELVEQEPGIAVVMTDQRMPRMSGDELLVRLGDTSDATRILITAFADLAAVIRAVNEGKIFAYVKKPWNADELILTVTKAAERFRLSRQLVEERQLLESSENRLRSQTSVLNSVLDSMGDGVIVVDRDANLLLYNRKAEALLGTAPSGPLSEAWEHFGIQPLDEDRPLFYEQSPLPRAMLEERAVSLEVLVKKPMVPERLLAITATPLTDSNRVAGSVALLRDVTEQRAFEKQFLHSQKLDAIGRFAGGVVHDFNNLLSVIQSYAQLILNGASPKEKVRDDLGQIVRASQHAATLTHQLLSFCRREELKPKLVHLNAVVTSIENVLRRMLGEDVVLSTKLAADLGVLRADPGQIDQIVLNLTVNARDAMSNGGQVVIETANVTLGESEAHAVGVSAGDYVTLKVSDSGTGMDAETKKRIFEPFFTTKEVGKGTGLGLSTVYGIVQQARGHIAVESSLGQGTTFTLHFPRVEDEPSAEEEPVKKQTSSGTGTVVLVEDNDAVRQVAARILKNSGYTVLDTAQPAEALRFCREHPAQVGVLLLDVVMPRTNGAALAAELSVLCENARVLFMSGHAGSSATIDSVWRGQATFLEKPFTPTSLVEKVREAFALRT
ncbi:MAG TPA: response regulator [Polyangiaceae bacterium]|nr:response regulator [Polyangiaceae bacterium]